MERKNLIKETFLKKSASLVLDGRKLNKRTSKSHWNMTLLRHVLKKSANKAE